MNRAISSSNAKMRLQSAWPEGFLGDESLPQL